MKTPLTTRNFIYTLTLLLLLITSCSDSTKNIYNKTANTKKNTPESTINFRTVGLLNDANKKVIDIASIGFNNSKELKESLIILKIKNDHQKIESELRKITNDKLIIIPEPIFDLDLNQTFLNGSNSTYYLVSLLEKEINNQIKLFESIEKVSSDQQFREFAVQSKELLINNNNSLEDLL